MRFDLRHGLPTAVSVLRRHLGWGAMLRVLWSYVRHGLRDPLGELPRGDWGPRRETLVRHQLRAAVLIDDALGTVLDEPARTSVLTELISETGARFIEANVPMPTAEDWAGAAPAERTRYASAVVQRFFNADVEHLDEGERHFAFEVTACRFVQLCAALERPHLAPLFCEADAVFFGRPESRLRLVRAETLARGGSACDFSFRFVDDSNEQSDPAA